MNIEKLKHAAREKYVCYSPDVGHYMHENFGVDDLDEIVTSTYLQAVDDAIGVAKYQMDMTVHHDNEEFEACDELTSAIIDALQSLKQTKDV